MCSLYESHHWHNQIRKVLDELSVEVCKVYETLYFLYWFKSLSVHDCLHLLRIHLYLFQLSEWTLNTWLTWLQTHICQCQSVSQLLKVIVVLFVCNLMLMQRLISEDENIIHIDQTNSFKKVLQDSVNISLKCAWNID
jgi:hypothetical protein